MAQPRKKRRPKKNPNQVAIAATLTPIVNKCRPWPDLEEDRYYANKVYGGTGEVKKS